MVQKAFQLPRPDGVLTVYFVDFVRTTPLLWLTAIFSVAILLISRWKGLRSLLSMAFSLIVIIGYIIPRILSGEDPLLVSIVGSIILLGVTLYLHFRWYEKPAITYLYWGTLVLHLALQRMKPGFIVLCLAICVVFSHPLQAALGAGDIATLSSRYLLERSPVAGVSLAAQWFPDVMRTIAELRHGTWEEPFAAVLKAPVVAMFGTLAFAVLAVARWRQVVPPHPAWRARQRARPRQGRPRHACRS